MQSREPQGSEGCSLRNTALHAQRLPSECICSGCLPPGISEHRRAAASEPRATSISISQGLRQCPPGTSTSQWVLAKVLNRQNDHQSAKCEPRRVLWIAKGARMRDLPLSFSRQVSPWGFSRVLGHQETHVGLPGPRGEQSFWAHLASALTFSRFIFLLQVKIHISLSSYGKEET